MLLVEISLNSTFLIDHFLKEVNLLPCKHDTAHLQRKLVVLRTSYWVFSAVYKSHLRPGCTL